MPARERGVRPTLLIWFGVVRLFGVAMASIWEPLNPMNCMRGATPKLDHMRGGRSYGSGSSDGLAVAIVWELAKQLAGSIAWFLQLWCRLPDLPSDPVLARGNTRLIVGPRRATRPQHCLLRCPAQLPDQPAAGATARRLGRPVCCGSACSRSDQAWSRPSGDHLLVLIDLDQIVGDDPARGHPAVLSHLGAAVV